MHTPSGGGAGWRLFVLLAVTLASQFLSAPVAAQTSKPGTLVRVSAREHMEQPCIGRVVSAADPLVVREEDGTMHYIPARQIELLEIRRTRSLRSREAMLGGLVGAFVGGAFGYASYRDDCEGSGEMFCFDFGPALDAAVFGSMGALFGVFLGYQLAPEGWHPLWKRGVQARIGLASDGVRLRLELHTR
jgi:hypothetical protein